MKQLRPIKVQGAIAIVPLTKGYEAVIDASDVGLVAGWNWCAIVTGKQVYAYRRERAGSRRAIYLHRVIAGAASEQEVDHVDCNALNNVRANLRLATRQQNACNRGTPAHNTSGLKGAVWVVECSKWRSMITANGKRTYLGYFPTKEAAHAAYARASARLHNGYGRSQ